MSDATATAWLAHMRSGDFEAAWQISDKVLRQRAHERCDHLPLGERWLWRGEPLRDRHVVIRCFHGLGDTIQFVRYAKLVRGIARSVTVFAQRELLALLKTMRGAFDRLMPLDACGAGDVEVELMELPHVFRTTLASLPRDVPYFHVQPREFERDRALNVGLVWHAGVWDERRSIPFDRIRQLSDTRGVQWHILQRGDGLAQWDGDSGVNSGSEDVLEAARVIAGLDLLISIDSMPAHLGGALGVPTWILLHSDADWRWMLNRRDSPSYPTMRLFRQSRPGEWQPVIDEVRHALRKRVAAVQDRQAAELTLASARPT